MTTPRRSVLAAIAGAPLAAIAAAPGSAGAATLIDFASMGQADLLELGTRNADAAFAALCADALEKSMRSDAAERLCSDAYNAAEADAPFPAALAWTERRRVDGETLSIARKWRPEDDAGGSKLWNRAHAEALRLGVPYSRSIEADLRAQYYAWRSARDAAEAHYMTRELTGQSDAAGEAAGAAFWRVADYPVTNADALLLKVHLRRERLEGDSEQEQWAAIAADLERVLIRPA